MGPLVGTFSSSFSIGNKLVYNNTIEGTSNHNKKSVKVETNGY
jgi:hypothetical protein